MFYFLNLHILDACVTQRCLAELFHLVNEYSEGCCKVGFRLPASKMVSFRSFLIDFINIFSSLNVHSSGEDAQSADFEIFARAKDFRRYKNIWFYISFVG